MVTTITDVRVPAGQFQLGRLLEDHPAVIVELERLIPTNEAIIPLFWVESDDARAVEESLRADPTVESVTQLFRTNGRTLFSVNWSPDLDELVGAVIDLGVDVLSATGRADSWTFRLQFRRRSDLQRFREVCRERGMDLELIELYNPLMPPEKGPLTSAEHDVLATAFENGYWDVPRGITLGELAALIGLSETKLSRTLRRGVKAAVEAHLYGPGGEPF